MSIDYEMAKAGKLHAFNKCVYFGFGPVWGHAWWNEQYHWLGGVHYGFWIRGFNGWGIHVKPKGAFQTFSEREGFVRRHVWGPISWRILEPMDLDFAINPPWHGPMFYITRSLEKWRD